MHFFNKNLVLVLFLFIVSCDDGFDEKAYKKDKNQKPNQVTYENKGNMKMPLENFNHKKSAAFERIRPYVDVNYHRRYFKGLDNEAILLMSDKDDPKLLAALQKKYGRYIHIIDYDDFIEPAEAKLLSLDNDEKHKVMMKRITKAIDDGTYTNNQDDYLDPEDTTIHYTVPEDELIEAEAFAKKVREELSIDKTEEINANKKAYDDKMKEISAKCARKLKKIDAEYDAKNPSSQKGKDKAFDDMHVEGDRAIDVKYVERAKNIKAYDDKVEKINAKYERINKALDNNDYSFFPEDYE
tara:strand:- start:428 stop:1318 length:891 start_codon:yes stop_codon:yes gene_type:complete